MSFAELISEHQSTHSFGWLMIAFIFVMVAVSPTRAGQTGDVTSSSQMIVS